MYPSGTGAGAVDSTGCSVFVDMVVSLIDKNGGVDSGLCLVKCATSRPAAPPVLTDAFEAFRVFDEALEGDSRLRSGKTRSLVSEGQRVKLGWSLDADWASFH